ncbi:DUF4132 domain-containing protein [Streptomyces sp. SL13]|uniref:DUF4132 domain-containing protein n=1 Tax=Streptantibioticus silvisoli TaxID=2705255 RepID=A0AA90H5D6_9ACTN|nr:DUF4132 domain-containing protein [Streptantibioticus silvisoli]MDI5973839.1 DUF4132 domain-containing protein [Streptantibioticus silvisoli]
MSPDQGGTGRRMEAAAATGDWETAAAVLLDAVLDHDGRRGGPGDGVGAVLDRMPQEARVRFADRIVTAYHASGTRDSARPSLLTLLNAVAPGLDDRMAAARRDRLAELSARPTVWESETVVALAEAELAATGRLPPMTVALIRRMGLEPYRTGALPALAKRLTEPVLNPGEQWSDLAMEALAGLDAGWTALVAHAATANSARPNAAWDTTARELLAGLAESEVRATVTGWLARAGRPRSAPWPPHVPVTGGDLVCDAFNANALRGLAWTLSLLPPHPEVSRALGALLETSLRKVPGLGPRNPKVANACVLALARIDDACALAEIARLSARVTYRSTLKLLDAALEAKAAALGMPREEVEELAVPVHGLTGVGRARLTFGDSTAEVRVDGGRAVVGWRNAAGRAVKSVPAAVRRDFAEELKELKAAAKDIDKMLAAQSERLDRQFLARRVWPYAVWRERYLDHPLTGTLARRLLWTVGGVTCGWADGALRTLDDTEPPAPAHDAPVTLWHPVGVPPQEVLAWREALERRGVTQPFKQAHREVYLLTDAERTTGTYSNRFAGHVLRQHQFHSLAAVRGWTDRLRLCVDDSVPPPVRELPHWGLRAEFWVAGDDSGGHAELSDSGAYLYLRTDQVRFYPVDAPSNRAHCGTGRYETADRTGGRRVDPLPLESVPTPVLSEVLRDVDLFVGVTSVGNDPTWQDGGPAGRYTGYWNSYGFGELNQTAQTRRDLLTRLLPRLAIGDRCETHGRFLHVRGTRHTYRIHLGSGNILIAPHDRYLCVVPKAAGSGDTGYLPFEGDRTLSVILSKAMLLAADDTITDPTILSQL